jgi:hypothetical protein
MQAAPALPFSTPSFTFDLLEARLPAEAFDGQPVRHATEVRPARQAPPEDPRRYQNFLIIAPETSSQAFAVSLARHLMGAGYAYVARPEQKQMEDDDFGVRYLPLKERLPDFGLMTAVISIEGAGWLAAAALSYPEARLVEIQLAHCAPDKDSTAEAAMTAALPKSGRWEAAK